MKKVLMIFGLLAAFLVMSVASFFIMDYFMFKKGDPAIQEMARRTSGGDSGVESESGGKKKGRKSQAEDSGAPGEFYTIDDLLVNPNGAPGRTMVKLGLALEYDPEEKTLPDELDKRLPIIRDNLLTYLGALPINELTDITKRETLRDSMFTIINDNLLESSIRRLYIIDFIRN